MPKIEILDTSTQPREYTWEEIQKIPGLWRSTKAHPNHEPPVFLILAGIDSPIWLDATENKMRVTDNSWIGHRFIPFKGKISIEWIPSVGG